MTSTNPTFADYRALRRRREALSEEHKTVTREYQNEYLSWLELEWSRLKGKRRKFPEHNWAKVVELPTYTAVTAMFTLAGREWLKDWERRRAEIEAELDRLATVVEPEALPDGAELQQVDWVYSGAYASQGFGAMKYTREAGQAMADKAVYYGLKAEVKEIGEGVNCGYGIVLRDVGVFANVDADGWDVIRRRPGVPLRDWIRSCWRRGVNPRVYNPFLPYGLEERMGLDYFGGEVKRNG